MTLSTRKNKTVSCWLGQKWARYAMDEEILRSVFGVSLECLDKKLPHYHKGMEMRFFSKEEMFLIGEIKYLLRKGITKESQDKESQLISPIFLEPISEDFLE